MLQFQTDWDELSGQEVLTCFLLPQLDDHQHRGEPTPVMERQLQMAVTKLERWATNNGFRFSMAKGRRPLGARERIQR